MVNLDQPSLAAGTARCLFGMLIVYAGALCCSTLVRSCVSCRHTGAQASASFKLQCEVDVGTYEEIDATNLYTEFLFGGVDSLNSELFFRSIFCRNLPCYYDK